MTKISMTVIGLAALAATAAWQFYLFVSFKDANRTADIQGGTLHLWLATIIALSTCVAGFLLFSRLLRSEHRYDMHITSQGHPLGVRTNKSVL